jgi:hypothetical protein
VRFSTELKLASLTRAAKDLPLGNDRLRKLEAIVSKDPSSFQATGDALVAVREWASSDFVAGLAFVVVGPFLYNYVMYRSRLVPRWLSGWGLVGAVLALVATVYTGFGFTTVNSVLMAPIGLQEMVLAVWLIVKGFNPSSVRSIAPSAVRSMTP